MASTTLSIRLDSEEKELIQQYAKMRRQSTASVVLESVMDRIEDEIDIRLYQQAMQEYQDDPVSYSLDEVEQKLGLA